MKIHQLRYFLSLARERHFGRASAACNISQPALSRAIRQLEYEFGDMLFHREPGRIELTALGKTLLPRFEGMFRELSEAKAEAAAAAEAKSFKFRLGLMCTIGPKHLIDVIRQLDARIPGLDLKLYEHKGTEVVDMLLKNEVDAAIAGLPHYPEEIVAAPLFSERYAIAFCREHPFERLEAIPFEQLEGENYVERLNCEFVDHHEAYAGEWTLNMNIRFRSEREDWVQAMILAGMGCSIVPEFLGLFPGVIARPIAEPTIVREISLLTMRGRTHTPVTEAFVRIVSSHKWPNDSGARSDPRA